jgi:uncharacterized protein (DUF2225 family)
MNHDNYVPEDIENGQRAVSCPICGRNVANNPKELIFEIDVIDTDFRIHTLQDDLLDDWLIQCPSCFYVSHDFSSPPKKLQDVSVYVESPAYLEQFSDNNPTTLELFSAYLNILFVDEARSYLIGDCYMRMSWLYDDDENEQMALKSREKAIQYFEKSLLETEMNAHDVSMSYYLIADFHRRNKDFDKARKNLYNLDTSIKMMKRLFDFQWKLISEKKSGIVHLPRKENSDEILS